jgi:hypothetical protein
MRIKRRDLLAIFLTALCVLSAVMLIVSCFNTAQFSWPGRNGTFYFVGWHRGKLHVARQRPYGDDVPGYVPDASTWGTLSVRLPRGGSMTCMYGPWAAMHSWLGVQWLVEPMGCVEMEGPPSTNVQRKFFCDYATIGVAWWWIAIVGGIYPLIRLRSQMIFRGRRQRGECLACGYDLRESHDRCPECGTPVRNNQDIIAA